MFQAEANSTPSPNTHIILPSGVAVIGIDPWVEKFTKLFQKTQLTHKVFFCCLVTQMVTPNWGWPVITSSPKKLVKWFNKKIPDASRKITADDVTLMTKCNLIGRYNYFIRQDFETIRGILLYEQLRQKRLELQGNEKMTPVCKMCG